VESLPEIADRRGDEDVVEVVDLVAGRSAGMALTMIMAVLTPV
jgi:hypothetical protein